MTNRQLDSRFGAGVFTIDLEQLRRRGQLSPGRRIQVLLDARELVVGLIRGRLRRRYPNLSLSELNLKVLEELARADRTFPRS